MFNIFRFQYISICSTYFVFFDGHTCTRTDQCQSEKYKSVVENATPNLFFSVKTAYIGMSFTKLSEILSIDLFSMYNEN